MSEQAQGGFLFGFVLSYGDCWEQNFLPRNIQWAFLKHNWLTRPYSLSCNRPTNWVCVVLTVFTCSLLCLHGYSNKFRQMLSERSGLFTLLTERVLPCHFFLCYEFYVMKWTRKNKMKRNLLQKILLGVSSLSSHNSEVTIWYVH